MSIFSTWVGIACQMVFVSCVNQPLRARFFIINEFRHSPDLCRNGELHDFIVFAKAPFARPLQEHLARTSHSCLALATDGGPRRGLWLCANYVLVKLPCPYISALFSANTVRYTKPICVVSSSGANAVAVGHWWEGKRLHLRTPNPSPVFRQQR